MYWVKSNDELLAKMLRSMTSTLSRATASNVGRTLA